MAIAVATLLWVWLRLALPVWAAQCANDRPAFLTADSGAISDGSDDFSPYRPGAECLWIISPASLKANEHVVFLMSTWELAPGNDRVSVYDGSAIRQGTMIGEVTGASGNSTAEFVGQPGRSITVEFVSDVGTKYEGWAGFWYIQERNTSMPMCAHDCYSAIGRGLCAPDGRTCICNAGYTGSDCHIDDIARLAALYSQCGGSSWISSTNWLKDSLCVNQSSSNWFGAECISDRISVLSLEGNNLSCPTGLPPLPLFLRQIDLSSNNLGSLPIGLDRLTSLQTLVLRNANLAGPLPVGLANGTFLNFEVLNLAENRLTGPLPDADWVKNLDLLNVTNNMLEGFIPEGVGSMQISASAWINGNRFWCPVPLNWNSLASLSDAPNACINVSISGPIPPKTIMTGGATITVQGNDLSSTIPYACSFNDISVPAKIINNTAVECVAPARTAGFALLALTADGRQFSTNSLPFIFTISCPAGSTVSLTSLECLPCPAGAFCAGREVQPVAASGFFPSPVDPSAFLECFRRDSCLGDGTCAIGYTGPRCVECTNGLVPSNGACIECHSYSGELAAITILAIFLMPLWWLRRGKIGTALTSVSILITFVQVIGLFNSYPMLSWPGPLQMVINLMSVTVLNVDYLNLECAFSIGFYGKLAFVWCLPIIFTAVLAVYITAYVTWQTWRRKADWREEMERWAQIGNTRWWISSNPEISCYDDEWTAWRPFAVIASVGYGAGIPAYFLYVMFHNRRRLDDPDVYREHSILYSSQHYRACARIPTEAADVPHVLERHAYVILISTGSHVDFRLALHCPVTQFIYLFAVIYLAPFKFERNNYVGALGWITTVIFLFAGIVLTYMPDSDTAFIVYSILGSFILSLVVMVHNIVHEWQLSDRKEWMQVPLIGRLVGTRLWDSVFPPPEAESASGAFAAEYTVGSAESLEEEGKAPVPAQALGPQRSAYMSFDRVQL
ncbi:hypothetical protein BDK51DRAFT_38016 [Blyttiomyces helicus]|uniref:CUB domain-containing protein n=1 Tax=Blyttiomyces helicus TaxID=388810 RepID=A0A4P9WK76_9FUNG|nr:hypothetical protein BDK51DRAFT_38016 [Blyttiomyces helicus]|eukprot:RKO93379.1 hypothetical protein BDK51DRAFT_38016 [Blyttiomyces helicus]